jgi:hypothetical protein
MWSHNESDSRDARAIGNPRGRTQSTKVPEPRLSAGKEALSPIDIPQLKRAEAMASLIDPPKASPRGKKLKRVLSLVTRSALLPKGA